jgi:hypothetical protein
MSRLWIVSHAVGAQYASKMSQKKAAVCGFGRAFRTGGEIFFHSILGEPLCTQGKGEVRTTGGVEKKVYTVVISTAREGVVL